MQPPPRVRVKFKGHRSEIDGDILRLPKKVDPQIPIEPSGLRFLLSLKDVGRLKSDGSATETQNYFWNGCCIELPASAHPGYRVRFTSARLANQIASDTSKFRPQVSSRRTSIQYEGKLMLLERCFHNERQIVEAKVRCGHVRPLGRPIDLNYTLSTPLYGLEGPQHGQTDEAALSWLHVYKRLLLIAGNKKGNMVQYNASQS
jgi:hypothetical protein